ncbi:hypothetical protein N665_0979s0004 [Sinapis alba]|nr:hypothetical protein N665_0979s0004 [Sinapis alba]
MQALVQASFRSSSSTTSTSFGFGTTQEFGTEQVTICPRYAATLEGRSTLSPYYIHGLAAKGVHYIHRPGPTLQDQLGFFLLPELGQERSYISETVFLAQTITVVRVLNLPGCHGLKTLLRFSRLTVKDLIFSSHMIFTLVFVLTYQKYGTKRFIKMVGWLTAFVQSLLIIASRKHYTVHVVIAWYTVNLVVFCLDKKKCQLPDRTTVLLPVISKDRTKEENHNLLNGNGVDPADWRPRAQVNGKIDSNGVHTDNSMNGA